MQQFSKIFGRKRLISAYMRIVFVKALVQNMAGDLTNERAVPEKVS